MNEQNFRQFKLSTGDEIVCEVLQYPMDDDDATIIVRNVYKIAMLTNLNGDNNRYYHFRPWMVYQDKKELSQDINLNHIVAEATPTKELLAHYFKITLEGESETDIEDILKKLGDIATEPDLPEGDSDTNLIAFPGNRRLH